MEEKRRYFNQQSNSAFQPQTYRQSGFEQVNPGRTEMHSSSDPGNGNKNRDSIHKMQAGDTLWDIAEAKLGNGSRWTELQKKDGGAFTNQEAHHLQIGTEVYLPNIEFANSSLHIPASQMQIGDLKTNPSAMGLEAVKGSDRTKGSLTNNRPFIQPKSGSFSGADLIKSVQSNPAGVSHREFAGGDRPVGFPDVRTLPATYETSQASSPQFRTGSGSLRDRANGIPLAQESTQLGSASDDPYLPGADNESLSQRIVGDAAAGYFMADLATSKIVPRVTPLLSLPLPARPLPDQSRLGREQWAAGWDDRGRNQFRDEAADIIGKDKKHPLKRFVEQRQDGTWKFKEEGYRGIKYQAGHMTGSHSGHREMFSLESERRNNETSSDEKKGIIFKRRAVDIGGVPVEYRTALDLETKGILPRGTVATASAHPGWARSSAVTEAQVNNIRDRLYNKQLRAELKQLRGVKDPNPTQLQRLEELKQLETALKGDKVKAASDSDLTSSKDQDAIRRMRGIVDKPKVTDREVSAIRNNLLREDLNRLKALQNPRPRDQARIQHLEGKFAVEAELRELGKLKNPSPQEQQRIQALKRELPSDADLNRRDQRNIQKLRTTAQTPGDRWRGVKVTSGSVDVVRDHIIRLELRNLKPRSEKARQLSDKFAQGQTSDADITDPAMKKRIERLREIAAEPTRLGRNIGTHFNGEESLREVYRFYTQALRDSVQDRKLSKGKPSLARRGKALFTAHRDKPDEANPERRRSVNAADKSPRQSEKKRGLNPRDESPTPRTKGKPRAPKPEADSPRLQPEGGRRAPTQTTSLAEPKVDRPKSSGISNGLKKGAKGAGKVFKPLGFAMDAYDLGSAMYKDGGIGKNTKKVAKEGAISWGSAAAGAGIGAAVAGPPGALVGGIVGGLAPVAVEYGPKAAKKVGSWVKSWFD